MRDTTTRDSYSKCKLKYSYEEKDFTCRKNSTWGGFNTGLRFHSKFRLFACKQWILSRCFCCRLFALSSNQTKIIHYIKLCRLQRVQFTAASFALGHYVKNFRDVLKIGWLPINDRRDLNLLKSCFKVLHNAETWPDYLKITQECAKGLHSSNSIRLVVPTENGTFQDNALKLLEIYQKLLETAKITKPF